MTTTYQVITDKIIDLLNKGIVPWQVPFATAGFTPRNAPRNLATETVYQGVNSMMLTAIMLTEGYSNPFFVSFKQAKERGGSVKRGETGHKVVFWKFIDKDENDDRDGESYAFCKYYTVFNLDQCEGITVPALEETESIFSPIETGQQIVDNMPNAPRLLHGYNGEAYYQQTIDTVHLPDAETFISPEFYYATCFHELAHSTGHSTRLKRDLTGSFGSKPYAREELIAEMSAAILCNHAGIDGTLDNSASYIGGWLRRLQNDQYLIIWAAGRAAKAVQYILNTQEDECSG